MRSIREAYQASGRIAGFDIARAIAIIGMVIAHIGPESPGLYSIQNGFPSALFAVLAGVSMSIMMAPANAQGGPAVTTARHRLLLRGAILFAIGAFLELANTPIAVVLTSIGLIFFFLSPLTRWRTRWVFLMLFIFWLGGAVFIATSTSLEMYSQWFGGVYPTWSWMAYGTAGILIHRLLGTAAAKWQALALIIATPFAVWGVFARNNLYEMLNTTTSAGDPFLGSGPGMPYMDSSIFGSWRGLFLSEEAHSGGIGDTGFSIALATAIIAACLLLTRLKPVTAVLYPVRAMGAMSLTAYAAHVISAKFLMKGTYWDPNALASTAPDPTLDPKADPTLGTAPDPASDPKADPELLKDLPSSATQYFPKDAYDMLETGGWDNVLITVIALLIFASLWKLFFRRGPLEQALRFIELKGMNPNLPPRPLT